ncbi:MAG: DUF4012 domain-containing protein [Bifidobacterium sp.]
MSRHVGSHTAVGSRSRHAWVWILVSVLLLVVATAAVCGLALYRQALQVRDNETQALGALSGFSLNADEAGLTGISRQLPTVRGHTRAANEISHGTLWKVASKLPVVGSDITTVQGMTSTMDDLVGTSVPKLLSIVNQLHGAKLSSGQGQLNLQPILAAQSAIKSANATVQNQVARYDALPTPHTSTVANAYQLGRTQLNTVAARVGQLSNTFQMLPDFLGSTQPRTYAIIAVTTSEARSAGGLVGSVGTMSTDNGKITVGGFRPNTDYLAYGAGNPTSDEDRLFVRQGPLKMSLDLRDLAAFPDTSRTAEAMRAIWQRTPWGSGKTLDGVLMVDPLFLQKLVGLNGKVTLSDGRVLTGDDTAQFLLNTVYKDVPVAQQNAYFGEIAEQTIGSMFSGLNFSKLSGVAQIMGSMAEGRHFSMYAFDSGIEKSIDAGGFTAHTPSSEQHPRVGVYVNEQNASKMDWYIHRTSTVTRTSCNANGSQTYHVDYTMTNTLKQSQIASLPAYIVGVKQASQPQGYGVEKTLIYAPAGGSIGNLTVRGKASTPSATTMNGTALFASVAQVAPQASVAFSFDVTTSTKAVGDLGIDQTPMGWEDAGVTLNTQTCSIGG